MLNEATLVAVGTICFSWYWMLRRGKEQWMLSPYLVMQKGQWHRVLSHTLIHADWLHLGMNMFILYEFGSIVSLDLDEMGLLGFPALYLAGAIGGAIPALIRERHNPQYRSLGASGAVSAVLMAFIALHPTHTLLLFFVIPVPAVVAGILFFWYESKMRQRTGSMVAHDAHLGGGVVGLLWVLLGVQDALPNLVAALQSLLL